MLAVLVVNSSLDNGDGSKLTLREAVDAANQDNTPDTILFDSTVFGVGPGLVDTITLTAGELEITESLTIDASTLSSGLTINASGNDPTPNSTLDDGDAFNDGDGSRVFDIRPSSSTDVFTLEGLTLTGGDGHFASLAA